MRPGDSAVGTTGWLAPEDHARAAEIAAGNVSRIRQITRSVSEATGIPMGAILGSSRARPITRARWLVWTIAHREGMSLAAIGRGTGHDHTSVLHGIRREGEERAREARS